MSPTPDEGKVDARRREGGRLTRGRGMPEEGKGVTDGCAGTGRIANGGDDGGLEYEYK